MESTTHSTSAPKVVCCCAPEDRHFCRRFERQLDGLSQEGLVGDYEMAAPGEHDIVASGNILVLWVSTALAATSEGTDVIALAVQRHQFGGAQAVAVRLDHVDLRPSLPPDIPRFPSGGVPLCDYLDPDELYEELEAGIRRIAEARGPSGASAGESAGESTGVKSEAAPADSIFESNFGIIPHELTGGLQSPKPEDRRDGLRDEDLCEIAVVAPRPDLRSAVHRIRRWCFARSSRVSKFVQRNVLEFARLDRAIEWVRGRSDGRLLLTTGICSDECYQYLHDSEIRSLEIVSHCPEDEPPRQRGPSASLIGRSLTVARQRDPIPALRKSVLRLLARRRASEVRLLRSSEEIAAYFKLRYHVWKSLGYLAPEEDFPETELELNYSDRTALPMGVFAHDGRMIGCARLVREMGVESAEHVGVIRALLEQTGRRELLDRFEYPAQLLHPFDVLSAFPNFAEYYRRLVQQDIPKAEVSRVIVAPGHRGCGLGEVVVDSLISIARAWGILVLFLACQRKHQRFYEQSGFHAIPDLEADRFFNIQAPSVAMQWPEPTWSRPEEEAS